MVNGGWLSWWWNRVSIVISVRHEEVMLKKFFKLS